MSASLSRRLRRIPLRREGGMHIFHLQDDGILTETVNTRKVQEERTRIIKEWRTARKERIAKAKGR